MFFYIITNKCGICVKPLKDRTYSHIYELTKEEYNTISDGISRGKILSYNDDFSFRLDDPPTIQITDEGRLSERQRLHETTDSDYLKYSRNVRLNEDVVYSQQCCDYIDQYNDAVSKTVSQPNYPAEVTYPIYQLPSRS